MASSIEIILTGLKRNNNGINMKTIILLFLSLFFSHSAFALKPLIVLSDKGGVPIDKYIAKVTKKGEEKKLTDPKKVSLPKPINFDPNTRYPIVTKEMNVGKVKPRKIKKSTPVGAEFAIVGFDQYSWEWMKKNHSSLEKKGTTILVVNVKNAEQLNAIQKLMPKNRVQAVPGTQISKELKIKHYPVLISDKGISQ
jgi:integrating conjugative element protein (TIGR03765 family)